MADKSDENKILEELDPRDRKNLVNLKKRLKSSQLTPYDLGLILPEALLAGEEMQNSISKSMTDITERAIDYSVSKDPEVLSTALFPIIGGAIRRAVKKALDEMLLKLNAGLEKTFSVKRLLWRIESWKTGVPFSEIIIRSTLEFRVEHVYLIHRDTGILLHGVSNDGSFSADTDLVASMLTVIQDYMKDSLVLDKSETVNSISAGEYSILIESGPKAILALVVRGVPDSSVSQTMLDVVENVHLKLSSKLVSFSGDTTVFSDEEALIKPCLLSREKNAGKKPVYAIVVLVLIAALITTFGIISARESYHNRAFLNALNNESGIIVVSSRRVRRITEVRVLRDARARTINDVAMGHDIEVEHFDFLEEEYISPVFGEVNVESELADLARRLGEYTLLFESNSGELRIGQEGIFVEAGELIAKIADKAEKAGLQLKVEITGHSAGTVQDAGSIRISEERAEKAMNLFRELNAPLEKYVTVRGVGISEPVVSDELTEEDREKNRSVTFKAIFE